MCFHVCLSLKDLKEAARIKALEEEAARVKALEQEAAARVKALEEENLRKAAEEEARAKVSSRGWETSRKILCP